MAEKETKTTKASTKATTTKTTTTKATTTKATPAKTAAPKATTSKTTAAKATETKTATAKTTAAKATETKAAPAKTAAPKATAPKTEAPKAAPARTATSSTAAAKTAVPKATATKTTAPKASVAAATAPEKEKFSIKKIIEKYSNSRGNKATIVGDMKKEKARANRQAAAASRSEAMARARDPQRVQTGLLWALIALLIASLISGVVLTIVSAAGNPKNLFSNPYASAQMVGYSAKYLGIVDRVKPISELRNQGLSAKGYPKFGSTLNLTTDEKTALIRESRYLTANGTWVDASQRTSGTYDKMDKDGYLYLLNGSKPAANVPERLYAHTASVGMYGGNVSDDEKAVIKQVTIRPRTYGGYYSVTGLYAPAGEVIKIEMSDADMTSTGGITIHIGQALYNAQANNIWEQRGINRMPVILNTMNITKETATYDEKTGMWTGYVGSFLGGPIYIRSESAIFSATISGGVNYSHFILGYTTPEEFEANAKSTAPYFDLEVWDRGVLHSGPKRQAAAYTFDDLYKVAVLWEKVSMVTTSVSNQGVVFLYDPFVAAGAAVAFPGRRSVNCPEGWMRSALNYKAIVSNGDWGNFHEYHHNFQDYGLGSGADGEVTNNGLTLVSYSLFTEISSKRQITGYGGAGLSGWNQYTVGSWTLNRVNSGAITSTNGLAIYATLLHNFGQDQYIKARGASGKNNYLNRWATNTHYDFTYFDTLIRSYGGGTYTPSAAVQEANYPLFVPVSSVYQTGRTYNYDGEKREIITMQPYVITYGEPFEVDLNPYTVNSAGQYQSGSVVIGNGFTYKIKGVNADGANGTFVESDQKGVYVFTPNKNKQLLSGKIYVTLEITTESGAHEWNGHKLEDVDLILEFKSTHEKNKTVLERTIYTYEPGKMYTDAEKAFEAGFKGYSSVETINHTNPTQNANTDVWFVPDTETGHKNFPNAKDYEIAHDNTITVIEGKLYFEEEGRYRIYLRGRKNCAVYYSKDGKTYKVGATIKDETIPSTSAQFRPNDPNTYFDIDMEKDSWLYFKEVLIVENAKASGTSYIGLGMKQWQEPMFTIQQKYYDKDGNEVAADSPNVYRTETKYFNYLGVEVSAEVASNTDPIPPEITSQPYVNAYRSTYEKVSSEFTSDYFYPRNYTYSYSNNVRVNPEQTLVYTNYKKGMHYGNYDNYKAENIADGNRNTFIHTNFAVTESRPLQFVIDMGEVRTVNRMIIYTQYRGGNGDWLCPRELTLEGSIDGNEFFVVGQFTNNVRNTSMTFNFDPQTFRYYRLTVTKSDRLLILAEIEMWSIFEVPGAQWKSPNDEQFKFYGNWHLEQTMSSFGQAYVGSKNATLKFEFEGVRLGILSSKEFETNFEITIDGKAVESVAQLKPFEEQTTYYGVSFLSELLTEGKHEVVIKCKGEMSIDSIILYPNPK